MREGERETKRDSDRERDLRILIKNQSQVMIKDQKEPPKATQTTASA